MKCQGAKMAPAAGIGATRGIVAIVAGIVAIVGKSLESRKVARVVKSRFQSR